MQNRRLQPTRAVFRCFVVFCAARGSGGQAVSLSPFPESHYVDLFKWFRKDKPQSRPVKTSFDRTFLVFGPDQLAVTRTLERLRRNAFVSPTLNNWTGVWDREDGDCTFLSRQRRELECKISGLLKCPVLAVGMDTFDGFSYQLFRNGVRYHAYRSAPSDIEDNVGPPVGGNSIELCEVFECLGVVEQVEAVLREPSSIPYLYTLDRELHRYQVLADLLGFTRFITDVN
jgi:hypothetical protein